MGLLVRPRDVFDTRPTHHPHYLSDGPWKKADVPTQTYHEIARIGLTLRLQSLPAGTTRKDIVEFFQELLDATPISRVGYPVFRPAYSLNPPTLANNPFFASNSRTLANKPFLASNSRTLANKPRSLTNNPLTLANDPHTLTNNPLTLANNPPTLANDPAAVVKSHVQMVGVIYSGPDSREQRATVTFWSRSLANRARGFSDQIFSNSHGATSRVKIDDNFLGLTTIYSSINSPTQETNLHIVAVHDLHSHAYNSYSTRQSVGSVGAEETLWLRDLLPKALQQRGISARVMTYGYRTELSSGNPTHFLNRIASQLESALKNERVLSPTIPIMFLCHSFGGYIVKKVDPLLSALAYLTELSQMVSSIISGASPGLHTPSPVSGCVFFGTQHNKVVAESAIMTMLFPSNEPLPQIRRTQIRQQTADVIVDINRLFEECIQGDPTIKIVTCYETKNTNGKVLVDKNASTLNSPNAISVPVYATHRDLVRPQRHSNPDFLEVIANVAGEALRLRSQSVTVPTQSSHPNLRASSLSTSNLSENAELSHSTASTRATSPAESLDAFFLGEDSSAYLTRYETVVLVDDSDSMWGPRWQQASDLLAEMAHVVAEHDPNGFELHFFNQADCDQKHVTTPELIHRVFRAVEPNGGSTPTATLLEQELSKYISRYRSNSKLKGLNLLVVTDGCPDNEEEVLEVISQASREMEVLKAGGEKIGIQFIQVGSDGALQAFMGRLDDVLVGSLQSNHIIVDRIPWDPEESDALLRKVLFGGIRQAYDDKAYEYATRSSYKMSLKILQSSKLFERRRYQLETPSLREVLLAAMTKCSPSILGQEEYYRTTFDLTWELLAFVRDNLGKGEKLSRVVTLTGNPENPQAATCEQYVREFWPNLGPQLLSFIEDVCDQCLRQRELSMTKSFSGEGSPSVDVEIKMKSEKTIVRVYSPLDSQIQVMEILAWLTAAIRASTPPSLSNSQADLTFEHHDSGSTAANFKMQPKPLNPIRNGSQMCWHPLFEHSVIAVQFPCAQRTQGVGVELSPVLMATLAGIRTAVEFRGGLILRGLSTALIPVEMTEGEDAIQWHLAIMNTSGDAITTDLGEIEGIDEYYKVKDVQQLLAKKAYLGWCSVATVLLGTPRARYQEVTWSDSSKVRRRVELSGFSFSTGSAGLGSGGPTATANFVIIQAQRTHFMDVENQLKDRLRYSIARPVIVYDTLDRRGWMIPIVCLMLYMVHLRVQRSPGPRDASQDGLTPIPYSRADREAAHEAYEVLTSNMEPHKWNDTLVLFYIALDTFFRKSKELSSKWSASNHSAISGFELMDAVLAENPFRYNSRQIQNVSGGWAQLGDMVGILFCRGIGDAIVPGAGANALCRPWSSVPSRLDYLGAYVPCVVEVLSREGKHKGSDRLRERNVYGLYKTCDHAKTARCFHLVTYDRIADPPNDKNKCITQVTTDEESCGAIIFGKKTTLASYMTY